MIFMQKDVNIFLSISLNVCFRFSKEPSDWDGSFEYPQHMLWLRNNTMICVLNYPLRTQRRLWSDLADAQADLSLRLALTHFVGFIMSWLRTQKKIRTSKRDYWNESWFSSIAYLFKMGTSLKGKNSLPEVATLGANSFPLGANSFL